MGFRLRIPITIVATAAAILASPQFVHAQATFSVVHAFMPPSAPVQPNGPLIEGTDGNFYTTTARGGRFDWGTVVRITPAGAVTALHEFNYTDGAIPSAGVVQGADGNFYGTTTIGGSSTSGTFFRITPGGTHSVLHSFTAAQGNPSGSLIEASDGNFYGVSINYTLNIQTVFKISPAGFFTMVSSGLYPFTLALQAADGNFYGFTSGYEAHNAGTLIRMTPTGTLTILHNFGDAGDGANPAGLMEAADGNFYGVTARGGSADKGTVFRLTPAGLTSVVASFTGPAGVSPYGNLVQLADGSLAGLASGDSAADTAFAMAPDGSLSLLHTFDDATEGSAVFTLGFVRAADGTLYGTAAFGGEVNRGTVFTMSTAGDVSVLSAFPGDERGADPVAIVRANDGKFYGTTISGGPLNKGTAFSLTPDGSVSWLHSFSPSEGPSFSPLIQASDGNLYGILDGSIASTGNAFRMTTAGSFTVLHQFDVTEAYRPNGLVEGTDGNFYGTAVHGGESFFGTFFRMTPDGTVTVLHSFANGSDDAFPGDLVAAGDGTFYGATSGGSVGGAYSTVFRAAADGSVTPLASIYSYDPQFPGLTSYLFPRLTLAADGNVYGIVPKSDNGLTAIFRVTPGGAYTVLGQLGPNDLPAGAPVQAPDGNLYGLTLTGVLYKITLAGGFEIMGTSGLGGLIPRMLIAGGDGYLYGTASDIPVGFGPQGGGAVFRLQVPMPALMTIDAPGPSPAIVTQPFSLSGWALDLAPDPSGGTGIDAVHVWAFPDSGAAPIFVGVAQYGVSRPDVAAAFGNGRFTSSGFELRVRGLAGGTYRLDAFAHRTASGAFDLARSVTVTMPDPQPLILIDEPAPNAMVGATFAISGWAIDPRAVSGTGIDAVHVYAYPDSGGAPVFLCCAYGSSRPDVGAIFGAQFTNSGYAGTTGYLTPGSYLLVVFARSTVTGVYSAQTRHITVRAGNPMMFVDAPVTGAVLHPPFEIRGWAVDTDALAGPGVDAIHVWAFSASGTPVFLGAATYGTARPDVAVYLGDSRFTNSGYSLSATGLSPGVWQLVIFGRSTVTGTFNQARVVSVTVN